MITASGKEGVDENIAAVSSCATAAGIRRLCAKAGSCVYQRRHEGDDNAHASRAGRHRVRIDRDCLCPRTPAAQEIIFSGGSHGDMLFARSDDNDATFSEPLNLSRSMGGDGKGRINVKVWHNGSPDLVSGPDGRCTWRGSSMTDLCGSAARRTAARVLPRRRLRSTAAAQSGDQRQSSGTVDDQAGGESGGGQGHCQQRP